MNYSMINFQKVSLCLLILLFAFTVIIAPLTVSAQAGGGGAGAPPAAPAAPKHSSVVLLALGTIGTILKFFSEVLGWLINLSVKALAPLLTVSGFVTNPMVVGGWAFIQGLANLFFILTLLFIALATAFHLEGFNAFRLLPRLLIAALLLNFSLVLCGVLVDFSRLLMAIISGLLANNNLNILDIGDLLLERSSLVVDAVNGAMQAIIQLVGGDVQLAFIVGQSIVIVFKLVFLFCLDIFVIGLLIRYIMLLLLIIISPLAFVAWVLPNTRKLAEQWWSAFLRYVTYGPIVLFILVLALNVGGNNGNWANMIKFLQLNGAAANWQEPMINIAIISIMLYVAATVGKNLSGSLGIATIGFVNNQRARAVRYAGKGAKFAYKNPKTAATIAGGVATGGLGGAALGLGSFLAARTAKNVTRDKVVRPIRDLASEVTRPIRRFAGAGEYSPYDDKGNLKKGSSSSGSRAGSYARREEIAQTQTVAAAGIAANLRDPALMGSRLRQGHVLNALGPNPGARDANIDIILRGGSGQQARGIAQSKGYLRDVEPARIIAIEAAIRANAGITPADQERIIDQLYTTLDEIRNE